MGYFKEEQIEEIEMQLQDQLSFSTFKEFYLQSELHLEDFEDGESVSPVKQDRWTLSLFSQPKSA